MKINFFLNADIVKSHYFQENGNFKFFSSITENAVTDHRKAVLGLERPNGCDCHEVKGAKAPQSTATQASAPHASQALLTASGSAIADTALSETLPPSLWTSCPVYREHR